MSNAEQLRAASRPAVLPEVPGLEVARAENGAAEYSGDGHDVFAQGERAWVWLADASGRGFAGAAAALQARACVRSTCLEGVAPSAALAQANRVLFQLGPPESFVSGVLLRWEPEQGALSWSGAGFEAFWIYRAAGERVELVRAGGVVLGMTADPPAFQDHELRLGPGDALLLATDGLAELRRADGSFLGQAEVSVALAERAPGATATELAASLLGWIEAERGGAGLDDDITILVVKPG